VEILLFYIPVGSAAEADRIASHVIEQRLAACANVFPIQSTFFWKGVMEHEEEYVLILKTLPALATPLQLALEALHAYETPCLISWPVTVNDAYGKWVESQVRDQ
jgi:periplasmic divalent cation tolerance protein